MTSLGNILPEPNVAGEDVVGAPVQPKVLKKAKALDDMAHDSKFTSLLHLGSVPNSFKSGADANRKKNAMNTYYVQGQKFSSPPQGCRSGDAPGGRRWVPADQCALGGGCRSGDAPGRRPSRSTHNQHDNVI